MRLWVTDKKGGVVTLLVLRLYKVTRLSHSSALLGTLDVGIFYSLYYSVFHLTFSTLSQMLYFCLFMLFPQWSV